MRTKNSLTIGVPVRNESRTLERFIKSLKDSVDLLPVHLAVETIICINGSTDGSEEIARRLVQKYSGSRLNISVVHSKEGKMEAQRTVLLSRHLHGMTAFFDADTIVRRHCLLHLWNAMEENLQLKVAYSSVKALNHGYETIVEWIESVHYAFPHFLTPRKYFHGRGYFIRPTELFFLDDEKREQVKQLRHKWMRLDAGPIVDDIHLSRVLVQRYGPESIQEVYNAIVEFTAPRTITDFYHGQRRLLIELRRLDALFPEHAHLHKDFERKPDRKQLRQASFDVRFHHFLYRFMEKCIRIIVRIEIFLLVCFRGRLENFWIPLKSTKENNGGNNDENR
jgi:glycosyltransferase involved in cell wall biosynthesis